MSLRCGKHYAENCIQNRLVIDYMEFKSTYIVYFWKNAVTDLCFLFFCIAYHFGPSDQNCIWYNIDKLSSSSCSSLFRDSGCYLIITILCLFSPQNEGRGYLDTSRSLYRGYVLSSLSHQKYGLSSSTWLQHGWL